MSVFCRVQRPLLVELCHCQNKWPTSIFLFFFPCTYTGHCLVAVIEMSKKYIEMYLYIPYEKQALMPDNHRHSLLALLVMQLWCHHHLSCVDVCLYAAAMFRFSRPLSQQVLIVIAIKPSSFFCVSASLVRNHRFLRGRVAVHRWPGNRLSQYTGSSVPRRCGTKNLPEKN